MLLPTHKFIEQIIVLDNTDIQHPLVNKLADIISNKPAVSNYKPAEINPDETIATILCSSGTTGLPKGVMTPHSNMTFYFETVK